MLRRILMDPAGVQESPRVLSLEISFEKNTVSSHEFFPPPLDYYSRVREKKSPQKTVIYNRWIQQLILGVHSTNIIVDSNIRIIILTKVIIHSTTQLWSNFCSRRII